MGNLIDIIESFRETAINPLIIFTISIGFYKTNAFKKICIFYINYIFIYQNYVTRDLKEKKNGKNIKKGSLPLLYRK